jgi:ArsR family transcriptional regulator
VTEVLVHDPVRQFKAEFFRALGHPVRLKILEFLRAGEKSVGELQAYLDLDPSAVSQQLAVLRHKNIVEARKEGTSVLYRVRDPQIFELLDVARRIFNSHLIDTQAMLEQMSRDASREDVRPTRRAPAKTKS